MTVIDIKQKNSNSNSKLKKIRRDCCAQNPTAPSFQNRSGVRAHTMIVGVGGLSALHEVASARVGGAEVDSKRTQRRRVAVGDRHRRLVLLARADVIADQRQVGCIVAAIGRMIRRQLNRCRAVVCMCDEPNE
jgi:hypothetical protein